MNKPSKDEIAHFLRCLDAATHDVEAAKFFGGDLQSADSELFTSVIRVKEWLREALK